MNRSEINWTAFLAGFALLWCGILLGVSFLATPAKFLAPSLTLPVALDVGRQTFLVFNRVEWLLCVTAAIAWILGARSRAMGALVAIICVIVLIETLWLLPLLDARVGLIIAGQTPAPSSHHAWYIWLEAAKAIALASIGVFAARLVLRGEPRAEG
jgi:hypothetical protein